MVMLPEKGREWEKEKERLLKREREQAEHILMLEGELAKQGQERLMEERANFERQKQAQLERTKLTNLKSELENLKILEGKKTEEREKERAHEMERLSRLTEALYQILAANLVQPSMTKTLPAYVQGTEAQMVVDFLNDVRHIQSLRVLELLPAGDQIRYLTTVIFFSQTRENEPYTFCAKLPKPLKYSRKPLSSLVYNVI
jgi:hypothetical protein